MGLLMYDAVTLANVPPGAPIVGCYVDGMYANETEARARFPHAAIITITVTGLAGAYFADCETGDLTPAQAADWSDREIAAGRDGGVYANQYTWDTAPELQRVSGPRWVANYDGDPTIPAGFVAKQYQTGAYDVSSVVAGWPNPVVTKIATPPAPPGPVTSYPEDNMISQVVNVAIAGGKGWAASPLPVAHVVSVVIAEQDPAVAHTYPAVPAFAGSSSDGKLLFGPGPYGTPADGNYGFTVWATS